MIPKLRVSNLSPYRYSLQFAAFTCTSVQTIHHALATKAISFWKGARVSWKICTRVNLGLGWIIIFKVSDQREMDSGKVSPVPQRVYCMLWTAGTYTFEYSALDRILCLVPPLELPRSIKPLDH